MAPFRALTAAGFVAFVAAEEPRRLGFSFGDVQVSGNGQQSPFSAISQQLSSAAQPAENVASSTAGSNPFASSDSDTPFGSFGADTSAQGTSPVGGPGLTQQSGSEMLQGMIRSFLANKQLQPGEEQCLEEGCSAVGSQAASVAQNIAMVGQQYEATKNGGAPSSPSGSFPLKFPALGGSSSGASSGTPASVPSSGPVALPAPSPLATPAPPPPEKGMSADAAMNVFNWAQGRRLQMDMDPATMFGGGMMAANLASQVHQLGSIGGEVAEKCLQSDGKSTLKQAALNAKNPAFLAKAMSTEGPEAFSSMAEAMSSWKTHDAKGFGSNMGSALRDIFLSDGVPTTLPEGLPDKKTLGNVTGGFLKGFFGRGMTATIKTPEMQNGMTVDLNKCVGNNFNLMRAMWGSVMNFYGKQATPSAKTAPVNGQSQATLLAYAAMQMPNALKQCNIGPEQEQALKDAIAGMGKGSSIKYNLPSAGGISKTQAVGDLADSVSGYENLLKDPSTSSNFGTQVGQLFQKAVETTLSQKYYVDKSGRLRHKLLQLSGGPGGVSGAGSLVTPVLLVITVVLLLLALVALKGRRALVGWKEHICQAQCPGAGAGFRARERDLEDVGDDVTAHMLDDSVE